MIKIVVERKATLYAHPNKNYRLGSGVRPPPHVHSRAEKGMQTYVLQ